MGGYITSITKLSIGRRELSVLIWVLSQEWPSALLSTAEGRKRLQDAAPTELHGEVVVYKSSTIAARFDEIGFVPELSGTSIFLTVLPEEESIYFSVSDENTEAARIVDSARISLWLNNSTYAIPESPHSKAA